MFTASEVVCLCCGKRVAVTKMNGEYRRAYHHGRNGRACKGSRMPVVKETIINRKETVNE